LLPPAQPVQLAYFVTDIRVSARRAAEVFGAGPFYVIDRIELEWGEHRGARCDFVHSSAYGQFGDLMMELVQQDEEGPSPFRDLYAPGEEGLHHIAAFVPSVQDAIDAYHQRGCPLATRAVTKNGGAEFAFIDATPQTGHMIEIYERSEALAGFYAFVREASRDWDGGDPVRSLTADRKT
jgi:catechol 2,3-dioxygenase-like lactoylglutathione lyase family enzyme